MTTTNNLEPFWEKSYRDDNVSTFAKGPTELVKEFCKLFKKESFILDVGCGEGRDSIFLARQGHNVDAFDISEAGINKSIRIANNEKVRVNFFQQDLSQFVFNKRYDVIISSGVLHLPEKEKRDAFILDAQKNTIVGGYHIVGIFTDRLPATPDNAPFTKSLFKVGEILSLYKEWEIINHAEGAFKDEHPGGLKHQHSYERIIAKKVTSDYNNNI
ncbi:MAG: methyltransferase domain-containing protein [Fibrobacteres bacterium]|nr:methyltransferase domain-containing protein [Fibrobacterota bacterium]